jgi:hypothetical protein
VYEHVLPEIALRRRADTYYDLQHRGLVEVPAEQGPPVFPDACPCCGAAKTAEDAWRRVDYACGAAYTPKPQIQNHTDKWWGTCPLTQARHTASETFTVVEDFFYAGRYWVVDQQGDRWVMGPGLDSAALMAARLLAQNESQAAQATGGGEDRP